MPVGKITVVRAPLATLVLGLGSTEMRSPFDGEAWTGHRGVNGGDFHAAPLAGGAVIVPFGAFESVEDVALAVRGLLGAALDRHDDARGLFVAEGDSPPEGSYEAAVNGEGRFVPVPTAEEAGAARQAGWSFAAAASALADPEAKKRAEERRSEEEDPLAAAKGTFDAKLAAREERGALRRTLSAALNHEVAHSAVGRAAAPEGDEEVVTEAAERLRRAFSATPDRVALLEGALKEAVEGEIARDEEIDPDALPPKVEVDAEEEGDEKA